MIVKLVAPHASLMGTVGYTLAIFAVAAIPGYLLAAATIDRMGRRTMQIVGFLMMAVAFGCLWLVPGATTTVAPFLVLFGATYFFAEFGPNTTTFVYPAEIFPVRVRTTCHGIAAAAGKIGAFVGTYALTALLPARAEGRQPGGHPRGTAAGQRGGSGARGEPQHPDAVGLGLARRLGLATS